MSEATRDSVRTTWTSVSCRLPCIIMERGGERGWLEHEGTVTHLTREGVFIECKRRPLLELELGVRLQDPEDEGAADARFFVKVVEVSDRDDPAPGFAAEFTTGGSEAREALSALIARYTPTPFSTKDIVEPKKTTLRGGSPNYNT